LWLADQYCEKTSVGERPRPRCPRRAETLKVSKRGISGTSAPVPGFREARGSVGFVLQLSPFVWKDVRCICAGFQVPGMVPGVPQFQESPPAVGYARREPSEASRPRDVSPSMIMTREPSKLSDRTMAPGEGVPLKSSSAVPARARP
jgi:hypothetical protein